MAKKGYKHKTIAFRLDDPEDMKLYDELQSKAYGDFSRITKKMWNEHFNEESQCRNHHVPCHQAIKYHNCNCVSCAEFKLEEGE